jgi:hypothetical protein
MLPFAAKADNPIQVNSVQLTRPSGAPAMAGTSTSGQYLVTLA